MQCESPRACGGLVAAAAAADNARPQEDPVMTEDTERLPGMPDQVDPEAARRAHEEQDAERERDEAIANGWLKDDPGEPQDRQSGRTTKRLYSENEQRDFRA